MPAAALAAAVAGNREGSMRYLIAMIAAMGVALLATLFVSSPVASWVVARFTFDSPDTVADLHSFVFMAVNALGLLVGWGLCWGVGGRLVEGAHRPGPGGGGRAAGAVGWGIGGRLVKETHVE